MQDKNNLLCGFIEELEDQYTQMKQKNEASSIEADHMYKELHDKKVGSIKELILDIQNLIKERQKLSTDIFEDLEKLSLKINNFVNEKKDDLASEELVELKRKIVEIEEKKAQEKLNAWRDISALKKELREHARELKDKIDGLQALESMIDY